MRTAHEETRALKQQIASQDAAGRALAEGLRSIYKLIEDGILVRNMTNDSHFPSYLAEATTLANALKLAEAALATPTAQRWREP